MEDLRAVAVACVLLYHAGIPFAGGGYVGVDVFFVSSGFLITGLLLRELEKTGTVSLARFYSRLAKRLLPLTVVVLAFVVVLSWLLFDPIRMDETSLGVVAGLQASPVQHSKGRVNAAAAGRPRLESRRHRRVGAKTLLRRTRKVVESVWRDVDSEHGRTGRVLGRRRWLLLGRHGRRSWDLRCSSTEGRRDELRAGSPPGSKVV